MGEIKLTVAQVAKQIGESVHVVRNWISDFRTYIPLEKSESGYNLFTQESINVITHIQKMAREQKLTTRQIEAILSGVEKPTIPDADIPPGLLEEMKEIKQMLSDQQAMNIEIMKRLEEHIKKRDENLMFVLSELREQKKLMAAAEQKPAWKRWFKR